MRQGFRVFFSRPLSFMGLLGVLLIAMLVAQLLRWVGPLLFSASLPLITLGFMRGTQLALQGRFPTPGIFIDTVRGPHARALWQLGGLYAAAMFLVALVYTAIDGGRLQALPDCRAGRQRRHTRKAWHRSCPTRACSSALLWSLATATTLLSLPFWHAPALVYWGNQPAGKAMFFSTVACWRNKAAFAVYALTGVGIVMTFGLAISLLFALLGQPNMAALLMMPAMLMFTAVFYASLLFTFADCFEMPSDQPP